MISVERAPSARAPFPYVGLATAVLMLDAILVAVLPPNPYRAAVAIVALFAMGYCALALVVGGTIRLTAPEILGFSVGLTILITSLSALAVSILGIPISEFAVVIVGLPIAILAWFVRSPRGGTVAALTQFTRGLFDFSDYSRSEKAVVAALLAAITAALIVLLSLWALQSPDSLSAGLAITGPDGTTGSLNTSVFVGQTQVINATAFGGSAGGSFVVRIRLVPRNATGNETFHTVPLTSPLRFDAFAEYNESFTLGPKQTWTGQFSIAIQQTGSFDLNFALLNANAAVVAANGLPVFVR